MTAYRVDELDAGKIHVVLGELGHNVVVVDGLGSDILVSSQLCCSKQEWQEVVVIQAPHSMRSSGLKPVCKLKISHHLNVPIAKQMYGHIVSNRAVQRDTSDYIEMKEGLLEEDIEDDGLVILLLDKSQFGKAVEPGQEAGLVSCTIVDSLAVTPALHKVLCHLRDSLLGERKFLHPTWCRLVKTQSRATRQNKNVLLMDISSMVNASFFFFLHLAQLLFLPFTGLSLSSLHSPYSLSLFSLPIRSGRKTCGTRGCRIDSHGPSQEDTLLSPG